MYLFIRNRIPMYRAHFLECTLYTYRFNRGSLYIHVNKNIHTYIYIHIYTYIYIYIYIYKVNYIYITHPLRNVRKRDVNPQAGSLA